jgi:hypothetical protein
VRSGSWPCNYEERRLHRRSRPLAAGGARIPWRAPGWLVMRNQRSMKARFSLGGKSSFSSRYENRLFGRGRPSVKTRTFVGLVRAFCGGNPYAIRIGTVDLLPGQKKGHAFLRAPLSVPARIRRPFLPFPARQLQPGSRCASQEERRSTCCLRPSVRAVRLRRPAREGTRCLRGRRSPSRGEP